MKGIFNRKIGKRIALSVLALVIVVPMFYLISNKSEIRVHKQEHFTTIEVSGTIVEEHYGEEPKLAADTGNLLFGGWFEDQACTVPVTSVNSSKTYYAKYLDPSVLSIKLQVKQNTDNTTDMRVVSTVDSLNYAGAGFDVYFGEEAEKEKGATPIRFQTTTVFQRIKAKSNGVAYKYSPKVVDADSEYFVTGTIKRIAANKVDKNFYIKPFWVTTDGVRVYGQGRFLSAKNGTDATNINVPVQVASNPEDSNGNVSVTLGGETKTAKVAAYKDGWVHLNIPVDDKATLASATKVTLGSASAIFRNHQNTGATVDTSWYDVDPNANEFVIATKADWEGFASIVNNKKDSFKGDTVTLVANLVFNEGTVNVEQGTWSGTTNATTEVGAVVLKDSKVDLDQSIPFDGTFEGDNNTISGFYLYNTAEGYHGLFRYVGKNGILKNLILSNFYMRDTGNGWRRGLLTCALSGSVDNVYLDETTYNSTQGQYVGGFAAIIAEKAEQRITNSRFAGKIEGTAFLGGFAGRLFTTTTIVFENCWNDGTINARQGSQVGGFLGNAYGGVVTFENCLNTGDISNVSQDVGGFVGKQVTEIHYENCVETGIIQVSGTQTVGAIAAGLYGGQRAYIKNVYTFNNRVNTQGEAFKSEFTDNDGNVITEVGAYGYRGSGTITGLPQIITSAELTGNKAYINTELDFWTPENPSGAWLATANGLELKHFSNAEGITNFNGLQREAKGWYYDAYVNGEAKVGTKYSIDNVDDMYGFTKLSATDNFEGDILTLTASLDFNPGWTASQGAIDSTKQWTPIGYSNAFKGTFDGNNKTISGLYTNIVAGQNGLFGTIESNAMVKNLTMENSLITTNGTAINHERFAGAIAGLSKGKIDSIYVKEDVTVQSNLSYVGGIVGQWNGNGTISNCWFAGDVICRDIGSWGLAGGIVGGFHEGVTNGTIQNCLNSGNITCNSWSGGGIIGGSREQLSNMRIAIQNSVNTGEVLSEENISCFGSVIGGLESSNTIISLENVYTTTDAKKGNTILETDMTGIGRFKSNTINGIVQKMTTSQMSGNEAYLNTELDIYSTNNISGVWAATGNGTELKKFTTANMEDGFTGQNVATNWYYKSYVNGEEPSSATAYEIKSAAEMYGFSKVSQSDNFSGDTVNLMTDICLNDNWSPSQGVAAATTRMTPIGQASEFCGTFNGNGNTISNLAISGGNKDANGLFGKVGINGVVKNFKLENSYIQVRCSNPTETSENSRKGWWTGAAVGRFSGSLIDSVYVGKAVTVDTDMEVSGGIVGSMNSNGTISECWFAGTLISNIITANGNNRAGGIVGTPTAEANGCKLQNCLNTGSIKANNYCSGGIIGGILSDAVSLTLKDCVNTGMVTSTGVNNYFGSVIGGFKTGGHVITFDNVYTTTDAKKGDNIIAYQLPGVGTASNSVTIYGNPLRYDNSFLAGENAYMNTNLDLYSSTSNPDGVWAATSSGVELKKFTTKNVVGTFNVFQADMSWFPYTNVVNGVSQTKEFTLTTKEQLFGFANLSQSNNFKGVTITLGNNITVNDADTADADKVQWHPIGRTHEVDGANAIHGYRFAGTFNGNNKTISGLYMKKQYTYMALFAGTEVGSMVKNLRIKDSYFEQLYTGSARGQLASVAADCRGNLDNVYSNATLVTNNYNAGGLVAWANAEEYGSKAYGTVTYKNCWFDGTITAGEDAIYVGGIASMVRRGDVTLENCLFSGTINSEYAGSGYAYVAGMVGTITHQTSTEQAINTLNLESCISAGTITDKNLGAGVGAIVGRLNWTFASTDKTSADYDKLVNWTKVNMNNVYASRDCYGVDLSFGWHKNLHDANNYAILDEVQVEGHVTWSHAKDRLMGYCIEADVDNAGQAGNGGYTVTKTTESRHNLDFTNDFAMVNSGVPIPKTMTDLISAGMITDISALNIQSGFSRFGWKLSKAENSGMGNYIMHKTDATDANYTDFVSYMTGSNGYTKFADNSGGTAVDGVYNTVLVKEAGDWVVNVTYLQKQKKLTLSVSTVGMDGLSKHLKQDDTDATTNNNASGTVTFTLSQLKYSSGQLHGGNQLFFQLPNGHFIISDGAHDTALEALISKLEACVPRGTKPIIDAWILTHQHSDHTGFLEKFWKDPSLVDRVQVEGFYFSEPSDALFQVEDYYTWTINGKETAVASTDFRREVAREYAGLNLLKTASGEKTPVYRVHTGERYYFNGLTLDIILTHEQIGILDIMRYNNTHPDSDYNNGTTQGVGHNVAYRCEGAFNGVSTTVLYTTNGGQKIYSAGDATHAGNDLIVKAYDTCGIKDYFHSGTNTNGLKRFSLTSVSALDRYSIGLNNITGAKTSITLSNIDVMVALHHGMNTLVPYYRYLATPKGVNASSASATMNKFDAILYPYPTIRVYEKNFISSVLPIYEYSQDEAQWGANDWVVNNLVTNKQVYTYSDGDVVVTFSGTDNPKVTIDKGIVMEPEQSPDTKPDWGIPF